VNPLQGTASAFEFSTGSTLPLVARPFGMTHWTPQTEMGRWIFDSRATRLQGIRATHQPSPWMGDYGQFLIMPQTGPLQYDPETRASSYRRRAATFRPDLFRARLLRYDIDVACSATSRCALIEATFPGGTPARVLFDLFPGQGSLEYDRDRRMLRGVTSAGANVSEGFAHYFVAFFDREPETVEVAYAEECMGDQSLSADACPVKASVEFGRLAGRVKLRIGTSFVGFEQAEENLRRELDNQSLDELVAEAAAEWNELLGRLAIETSEPREKRIFYSCLYRVLLFPRRLYEYDRTGKKIHRSPYDGAVHEGVLHCDHGFWDTFRTVYSLFAIAYPDIYEEVLEGWLNAYRESGWFPKWPSPGHCGAMTGTHIDSVYAEALAKGIPFPLEEVFDGLMKHARGPGPKGTGRPGIEDFNRLGYVPADASRHSVAETLDHAFGNFCLARLAREAGRTEDLEFLERSSRNYRKLFDPETGFMRPRDSRGEWVEPFDEFAWGGPYVEGGAWQWTWAVPHDPEGLIDLVGGPERMVERLDQMLTMAPTFRVGFYSREIHEMSEMAAVDFGQYAQSNQPVHHVLFLFSAAGRPDLAQKWVRQVLRTLYTEDVFPGDEDNGEMSAWYILNALGVFPLCPASGAYFWSSPLFSRATITVPGRRPLVIESEGAGDETACVAAVDVDGERVTASSIQHRELIAARSVKFVMCGPR